MLQGRWGGVGGCLRKVNIGVATHIANKFLAIFQWIPSDVESSGSHLVRAGFGTCVGINPIKPHKFGWMVVKFLSR